MISNTQSRPAPDRSFRVDMLPVEVYANRSLMGTAAALDVRERMLALLRTKDRIALIFAAAPSQNELLATLASLDGIPWERVSTFHMDEYVGLPPGAQQSFGTFLRERLFDRVKPGRVHYLDGDARDPQRECDRYATLLQNEPPDIVCLGIGENGHIAFNDPGVADFSDPARVKIVELDERSRLQQVHDGCFPELAAVPQSALTLTIPALTAGRWLYCIVPGPSKAQAVNAALSGPITHNCPASVLRRHGQAMLYLDRESSVTYVNNPQLRLGL